MMIPQFPEDETILSAYLDGQLDFELRQAVESSLVSNPQFAEKLRHLGEVKELIAGLDSPKLNDLSRDVLNQIHGLQKRRDRAARIASWFPLTRSPQVWGGGGLIAASLLIGLIPFFSHIRTTPLNPDVRALASEGLPKIGTLPPGRLDVPGKSASALAPNARVELDQVPKLPVTVRAQAAGDRAIPPGVTDRAAQTHRSTPADPHDRVQRLLDNPNERHVFLVADQIGGAASKEIASLIEQSVRTDYFTITVAQGIVIDPEHPTEAKVFAFTIDDSELDRFRSNLKARFKGREQEIEPRPEIMTQLTDIGQVLAYSPPAVGEIVIPQSDVALKAKPLERSLIADPVHLVDNTFPGSQTFDGLDGKASPRNRKSNSPDSITKNPDERNSSNPGHDDPVGLPGQSKDQSKPPRKFSDPGAAPNQRRGDPEAPPREIVVLVWISSLAPG